MTLSERTTERTATPARWWHLVTLVVIVASVVTQLVQTTRGVQVLPVEEGGTDSTPERVLRLFSYFTIQSNILVAAAVVPLVANPGHDGAGWRVLRYMSLLGITLTGIIYWPVLHGEVELTGINILTNYGLHAAAPVLGFFGWLLFGPRPRVDMRTFWWALVWPVAWIAYTLIHGAARDWYPYPFIDVNEHGYGTVLVTVVVISMFFVAMAWFLKWLDGRLRPAPGAALDDQRHPHPIHTSE